MISIARNFRGLLYPLAAGPARDADAPKPGSTRVQSDKGSLLFGVLGAWLGAGMQTSNGMGTSIEAGTIASMEDLSVAGELVHDGAGSSGVAGDGLSTELERVGS